MSLRISRGRRAASSLARLLLAAAWLVCAGTARPDFLDAATQQKVRAATFEVVMRKPDEGAVTYEKPLPLDLLPYQLRTDKYFPVGTAFALGNHRFATAAHVLNLGLDSQWGTPELRDAAGRVYPLGQILKYSTARDFAVFTLAEEPAVAPLEIGPHPALDEAVYAVGNALGEGVVIRDGLYTSDTPEERDNRWKWLRFSAAASPGNSGGPLLDKAGRLIGIVLRKSQNENLNYALPIDEVQKAKDNIAVIDSRDTYQLDVLDFKQTEAVDKEFALPRDYAAFRDGYRQIWDAFEAQMLHDLLANNADKVFPHGAGATELLHSIQIGDTPGLLARGADGNWRAHQPAQSTRTDLGHNGFVALGGLGSQAMVQLRRPDDVPAEQFYGDSRLYMDSLLKGLGLQRNVGSENVKITSLGAAQTDSVYTDSYGRKWQLRQWCVPYQDYRLISLALPLPQGYAALVRAAANGHTHDSTIDLEALADFIVVSYGGTLQQWQDFRKLPALLPQPLQPIELAFDYGKSLHYTSPRLAFSYTPALQKITPSSGLYLDFSYFQDGGHAVWDVARVKADEDAHNKSFVAIARHMEPAASMGDDFKAHWDKILRHQHPYDAVLTNDGDLSYIRSVHAPLSTAGAGEAAVLYSVTVQNDGAASQAVMQTKLEQLMQGLSVKDDLAPQSSGAGDQD